MKTENGMPAKNWIFCALDQKIVKNHYLYGLSLFFLLLKLNNNSGLKKTISPYLQNMAVFAENHKKVTFFEFQPKTNLTWSLLILKN